MDEHRGKPLRPITEGKAHSAHFYAQRIQHQTAFLAVKNLHPVPRCIDKHENIPVAYVHPHPVVHYATQTIESHTHVHRFVVEPIAHGVIQTKHCLLQLVPLNVRELLHLGCVWPYQCGFEVL